MPVLAAQASLCNGRETPRSDGHRFRCGGDRLRERASARDEHRAPCGDGPGSHARHANRSCLVWLLLLGVRLSVGCTEPPVTYADYGDRAVETLQQNLYTGSGTWYACSSGCGAGNLDWGDDSLTYTLYLRWSITRDPLLVPIFAELAATAASDGPCRGAGCGSSDVPEWDAIADEREFEATGDSRALDLAARAYASVRDADAFALGACPALRYQHAF